MRITTEGALGVEKRFMLHQGDFQDPAILEAIGHVWIAAVMPNPTHYEHELYAQRMAPDTLDVVEPWFRLSAADSISATKPRLAFYGESLVAVWSDTSTFATAA